MYDTVDRAALGRVSVGGRDGETTTYRTASARESGVPASRRARRDGADPGAKGAAGGKRKRRRWTRRLLLIGAFTFFVLFAAGCAVLYAATRIPLPSTIAEDAAKQVSVITYADGKNEVARIGTVNRTNVSIDEVSDAAQHAVLAAENKDFYSEPGISPRGIARAMWANVRGREISQGGSTITQQYAKNAFLNQKRTFTRKVQDIALAVKLDRKYTKDEILGFYLNTIYFGRGSYGIEAAAKTYFGVSAKDLTAEQGAVIAGLIRSPNNLDPRVDPAAAGRRWRDVMATMAEKGWLDAPPAPGAEPPPTKRRDPSNGFAANPQAAYIREQVKRELAAVGITEDNLNLDGLRISTTIDVGRQTAAFQAVGKIIGPAYAAVPDIRTGVVAIQPGTGRVLAWYGGSIYGPDANGQEFWQDNVSQAKLPPGSTFKPITLVAALKEGKSIRSVWPAPKETEVPGYKVVNDEGDPDFGYVDLAKAMAESINTVYVPLGIEAGLKNVVETAYTMGVSKQPPLTDRAGVSLGIDAVSAKDMVTVYGTLAGGGTVAKPHVVDKVVDNSGEVIYQADGEPKRVLPAGVVADTTYALEQVIDKGTGKKARLAGDRPAAGKTGTTDDFRSAWFCGYTKEIASCVNMFRGTGEDTDAFRLKKIPGAADGVYGGTFPALIWKTFMDAALNNTPVSKFEPPVYGGTVTDASPPPNPTPTPAAPTPAGPPPSAVATPTKDDILGDLFPRQPQQQPPPPQEPQEPQRPHKPQPQPSSEGITIKIS
jgi:membrane peptidoglycan carboxypeptidase